jgi:hypothetical protein
MNCESHRSARIVRMAAGYGHFSLSELRASSGEHLGGGGIERGYKSPVTEGENRILLASDCRRHLNGHPVTA